MISNKELNPFYMELVDTSINEIPIKIDRKIERMMLRLQSLRISFNELQQWNGINIML